MNNVINKYFFIATTLFFTTISLIQATEEKQTTSEEKSWYSNWLEKGKGFLKTFTEEKTQQPQETKELKKTIEISIDNRLLDEAKYLAQEALEKNEKYKKAAVNQQKIWLDMYTDIIYHLKNKNIVPTTELIDELKPAYELYKKTLIEYSDKVKNAAKGADIPDIQNQLKQLENTSLVLTYPNLTKEIQAQQKAALKAKEHLKKQLEEKSKSDYKDKEKQLQEVTVAITKEEENIKTYTNKISKQKADPTDNINITKTSLENFIKSLKDMQLQNFTLLQQEAEKQIKRAENAIQTLELLKKEVLNEKKTQQEKLISYQASVNPQTGTITKLVQELETTLKDLNLEANTLETKKNIVNVNLNEIENITKEVETLTLIPENAKKQIKNEASALKKRLENIERTIHERLQAIQQTDQLMGHIEKTSKTIDQDKTTTQSLEQIKKNLKKEKQSGKRVEEVGKKVKELEESNKEKFEEILNAVKEFESKKTEYEKLLSKEQLEKINKAIESTKTKIDQQKEPLTQLVQEEKDRDFIIKHRDKINQYIQKNNEGKDASSEGVFDILKEKEPTSEIFKKPYNQYVTWVKKEIQTRFTGKLRMFNKALSQYIKQAPTSNPKIKKEGSFLTDDEEKTFIEKVLEQLSQLGKQNIPSNFVIKNLVFKKGPNSITDEKSDGRGIEIAIQGSTIYPESVQKLCKTMIQFSTKAPNHAINPSLVFTTSLKTKFVNAQRILTVVLEKQIKTKKEDAPWRIKTIRTEAIIQEKNKKQNIIRVTDTINDLGMQSSKLAGGKFFPTTRYFIKDTSKGANLTIYNPVSPARYFLNYLNDLKNRTLKTLKNKAYTQAKWVVEGIGEKVVYLLTAERRLTEEEEKLLIRIMKQVTNTFLINDTFDSNEEVYETYEKGIIRDFFKQAENFFHQKAFVPWTIKQEKSGLTDYSFTNKTDSQKSTLTIKTNPKPPLNGDSVTINIVINENTKLNLSATLISPKDATSRLEYTYPGAVLGLGAANNIYQNIFGNMTLTSIKTVNNKQAWTKDFTRTSPKAAWKLVKIVKGN